MPFSCKLLKNNRLVRLGVLTAFMLTILIACNGSGEVGSGDDQIVVDYSVAYIKRPIPVEIDNGLEVLVDTDIREIFEPVGGGDIFIRERAAPSAAEINITRCLTTPGEDDDIAGDVKDLEVSFDGARLIFALILPRSNNDEETTWDIYEYDMAVGGCPIRLIGIDISAGEGDDISPAYLPDGRIVFSSSRQSTTGETLLNEGKSQFSPMDESLNEHAGVLHVMDGNGTNIRQISFNQSHDLDPSVMLDGRIIFSRWENAGSRNAIHLYTIRPDGTELKALYGIHEHDVGTNNDTVQFVSPRQMEDGQILAMLKSFDDSRGSGIPVIINVADYADNNQPTWPNQNLLTGMAQSVAIPYDIRTDDSISPVGRYRSVYPLWDGSNRALVSWTQCRLLEDEVDVNGDTVSVAVPCGNTIAAEAIEAFPLYGIYLYNYADDTQKPIVLAEEGILIEEPVVMAPRTRPQVLIDKVIGLEFDQVLAIDENVGILHIRSVYDFDGRLNLLGSASDALSDSSLVTDLERFNALKNPALTSADERTARFLRIVKAASIPDPRGDGTEFDAGVAFGRGGRNGGMREIIGYAPIEPDGSVMVKVPANVPLAISIVDRQGRRISARHQNWIQLRPGETLECNGCHNHSSGLPHGYSDSPATLNSGAPTDVHTFAGTNGDFVAQMGETMAEARLRVSCTNSSSVFVKNLAACPELSPAINPNFFDDWAQDDDAVENVIDLQYEDLDTWMAANLPATDICQDEWSSRCRTIINYQGNIHSNTSTNTNSLWNRPRTDPDDEMVNMTCTVCHNNVDEMNAPRVPEAQLDLSHGVSPNEADHFNAYRELLFPDNEVLADGTDVMVQAQDADGNDLFLLELDENGDPLLDEVTGLPILVLDDEGNPIPILVRVRAAGPSMSVNGALASGRFFNRFNAAGDLHEGLLTPAEVRFISEWLDIGAQYFNDSFDAQ